MGVDFFRRAVELAGELRRPGQRLHHTIQTNGTLLTDEWCDLFSAHDFLVGISIDGPPALHDAYRVDKRGGPTFDKVRRGWELLRAHGVDMNVLCTVHAANQDQPLEVYRFFRDELGARHVQLIPIVERDNDTGFQEGTDVTRPVGRPCRVGALPDRGLRRVAGARRRHDVRADVRRRARIVGRLPARPCASSSETCGDAVALEHNGDLYSCDHFVEPKYLLGNIHETHMVELLASPRQRAFGDAKRDTLPRLLPGVRRAVRLSRRVPEEPVHAHARR